MATSSLWRATPLTRCLVLAAWTTLVGAFPAAIYAQQFDLESPVREIREPRERLEMIVNTSRILTLEMNIPQVQVNNPDLIKATPLAPNEVQLAALAPGVTQVNLWDEEGNIHTVEVIIYGDSRELTMLLKNHFPNASLKVNRLASAIVIEGYIDNPEQVSQIIMLAEEFSPKVINLIKVGGVQQVLLRVKVMEVSRTKLRQLSHDFASFQPDMFLTQGVGGLLGSITSNAGSIASVGGQQVAYGVFGDNSAWFGLMQALRQNNLLKILAEPDLVTVSGRPASFNVGGEFPILVPQSLGTVSIMFKKFGTQLDFVPLVLGGGRIRLEVRPRVSEIDETRSVRINDIDVPGLRVREVNTGVEMRAGQTLALAGLIQNRVEAQSRAIPWIGELPWIGAAFRSVREVNNEIELLILVTPYLIDPMDPEEVPHGGPGLATCSPSDCDLYLRGHLEVPCGDCANCQGGESWSGGVPYNSIETVPTTETRIETHTIIQPSAELNVNPANARRQNSKSAAGRNATASSGGASVQNVRRASSEGAVRRAVNPSSPVIDPNRVTRGSGGTTKTTTVASRRKPRRQPKIFGPVGYDLKD